MSILFRLLKDIFLSKKELPATQQEDSSETKKVLNVGGNNKAIPIPDHYVGWRHDLLDIDPRGNPDIVCDARELTRLPGGIYDAIYCSHNLEHYYRHHGLAVVKGFHHMLKEEGFAEVRVPDISKVIKAMRDQSIGLDELLYISPAGPITAHDVIYGFQAEIEQSGQDFYAHKTGFTPQSLTQILLDGGFQKVILRTEGQVEIFAIHALAFKKAPGPDHFAMFEKTWDIQPSQFVSG